MYPRSHLMSPINFSQKTTLLFDFDGTLVDVLPLFVEICNTLAPRYGYRPLTQAEIPALKHQSAWELVHTRLTIIPWWRLWFFGRDIRRAYERHIERIGLFPGITDILTTLRVQNYTIGIVSSNTTPIIETIMRRANITIDFIETGSAFGKSRTINRCLAKYHLNPTDVLYIGDEVRDVLACQKSGIDMLAVTWGLNSQESLTKAGAPTVDTPVALLTMFVSHV